jgi:hypothetical protein
MSAGLTRDQDLMSYAYNEEAAGVWLVHRWSLMAVILRMQKICSYNATL